MCVVAAVVAEAVAVFVGVVVFVVGDEVFLVGTRTDEDEDEDADGNNEEEDDGCAVLLTRWLTDVDAVDNDTADLMGRTDGKPVAPAPVATAVVRVDDELGIEEEDDDDMMISSSLPRFLTPRQTV